MRELLDPAKCVFIVIWRYQRYLREKIFAKSALARYAEFGGEVAFYIAYGGYVYISPEECAKQRGGAYNVILKDILRGQLRKINRYSYCGAENEFSAANIDKKSHF